MADETPKFDFTRVNYGWRKGWMRVMGELAQVSVIASNSVELNEDAAPTDEARLNLAQIEAVGRLSGLQEKRDEMVAQTLVSIPDSWLDGTQPDDLDWSDVDSLAYLKSDTEMNALIKAMSEAQQANSKN